MAYIYQIDATTQIWQVASVPNHTYKLQSVPKKTEPATNGRINATVMCASKTEDAQIYEMM